MGAKIIYHSKSTKERKSAPGKKTTISRKRRRIGTPYSPEDLGKLISALSTVDIHQNIWGVNEYAENQERISEATASAPDISETEIVELVVAVVLKNQERIIENLKDQNKIKTLTFLSKSSSVPSTISEKAETALNLIEKAPKEEKEKEGPLDQANQYNPKQVEILVKNLDSRTSKTKIAAAIQFIRDYSKITPTVSQMPLLTVTDVTVKAVKVIEKHSELVVNEMVKRKMLPELTFISSLPQISSSLKTMAENAIKILKPRTEETEIAEKVPSREDYSPKQLADLLKDLTSIDTRKVVMAAVEFLKNYDVIIEAVSKAPLLTVTEVTSKAVTAIENNLTSVLKKLEKTKEAGALRFLSGSSKFSLKTQKRAEEILKKLLLVMDEE